MLTLIVAVWGAIKGLAMFPPGRYPQIVLAAPGLLEGGLVYALTGRASSGSAGVGVVLPRHPDSGALMPIDNPQRCSVRFYRPFSQPRTRRHCAGVSGEGICPLGRPLRRSASSARACSGSKIPCRIHQHAMPVLSVVTISDGNLALPDHAG